MISLIALLSRLRVTPRLALAFGLVLLVNFAGIGLGLWRLDSLQKVADELGSSAAERALLARELHGIVVISAERAQTLMHLDDEAYAAAIAVDRKVTSARSEAVRKRLEELADTQQTRELFAAIDAAGNRFRDVRNALVKRKAAGESVPSAEVQQTLRPVADDYAHAVERLADYQQRRVAEARAAAQHSRDVGIAVLLAGAGLGLALSVAGCWALSRSIIGPLREAAGRADRIAGGDLSAPAVADLGRDELQTLLADISRMQTRLGGLVAQVKTAAGSVNVASAEIAAGNRDLSSRTENAASSLQQTAASMETLARSVRGSAEAAREASDLACASSDIAARGGQVVSRVVDTMAGISDASRRIAEIVGVIDGIAFQTNILALNAAVEAARAGEQGRGFAVVAGEVRGLAQNSGNAAREIKALIETSAQRVDAGAQLVQQAGATMDEIVASVARVSAIIARISQASTTQSADLEQVHRAVLVLDGMTQQNSALVEQSTAATESLDAQTNELSQVVSGFRL